MVEHSTILDALCRHEENKPDALAYRFLAGHNHENSLTYEELAQKVRRVACYLARFAGASDRVILLLPSGTDYLISLLACFWQGIVAVPAYPPAGASNSRLLSIISDCKPKALLVTSDVLTKIREGAEDYSAFGQLAFIPIDVALATPGEPSPSLALPSRLAFLQYTSGSTSAPKGVMVTHANLVANLEILRQALALGKDDIHVSWLPLFHDMGLICGTLLGLYVQNPVIFMSPIDFVRSPTKWLKAISEYGATVSGGPNFAYDLCCQRVKDSDLESIDLSRWRIAYNAAEPVRWDTLKAFEKKFAPCGFQMQSFFPGYGMAETTLLVSGEADQPTVMYVDREKLGLDRAVAVSPETAGAVSIVCCGSCEWGDQEVKIVDPTTCQELAPFSIGELWIKGSHITQGIYGNPEATQKAYQLQTAEGTTDLFRTGDLGFLDEQKKLYITGRLKDLIIVNGQNFYPHDIELAAEKASAALVQNGTVAIMQAEQSAQVVFVAEITKQFSRTETPDYSAIVDTVMRVITEEVGIVLKECVLVPQRSLPKTSSGKIQRQQVRQMLENNAFDILWHYRSPDQLVNQPDFVADVSSSMEEKIIAYCRYWIASRLNCNVESVNIDKQLMAFGLDSLNVVDLASGINKIVNKKIDENIFYQDNTIATLARWIANSHITSPTNENLEMVT